MGGHGGHPEMHHMQPPGCTHNGSSGSDHTPYAEERIGSLDRGRMYYLNLLVNVGYAFSHARVFLNVLGYMTAGLPARTKSASVPDFICCGQDHCLQSGSQLRVVNMGFL